MYGMSCVDVFERVVKDVRSMLHSIDVDKVLDVVFYVVQDTVNDYFWPHEELEELDEEQQEEIAEQLGVLVDIYRRGVITSEEELEDALIELVYAHGYDIGDFIYK